MEADLKGDKQGLGLATIRKHPRAREVCRGFRPLLLTHHLEELLL
jgi:hypothetical protein